MWHFGSDERPFSQERFKPKLTFNPRNKDAVIGTCLSCLEERLLDIEIPSTSSVKMKEMQFIVWRMINL